MLKKEKYQQLIGALLYLAVNSRPDIAASEAILSQHNQAPTAADWNEVKRVARYLKGTKNYELQFGEKDNALGLIGYTDADWAENRTDRKSNSCYLFKYFGSPISWSCRKQSCVSLSPIEAEYILLSLKRRRKGYGYAACYKTNEKFSKKILMYEDNQSCLKLIDNKKFNNRTKHIDTKFHFLKELKDNNSMEFQYCPTEDMIDDMMTKSLEKIKLKTLCKKCGLKGQ